MPITQSHTQDTQPQPLVSFVITTYNLPLDMLQECIKSILVLSLRQQDREIIVIDDGSDVSIINDLIKYRDDIIYLRQKNQGLSVARNTGIIVASGKYIQFVDGDDRLIQAPYEHCLDITRYHNPDMVLFNEMREEKANDDFSFESPVTGSEFMRSHNLRASACGYIFKKQILGTLRFTRNILHEDEEFTPQLMIRAERVFCTNADAYLYKKREYSITSNKDKKQNEKRLNDTEHILYHLQNLASELPEFDRVAMNRRIAQLTMDYLYNVIHLTHSKTDLEEAVTRLRQHCLFPLPEKEYGKKYSLFRKVIKSRFGRDILLLAIRH